MRKILIAALLTCLTGCRPRVPEQPDEPMWARVTCTSLDEYESPRYGSINTYGYEPGTVFLQEGDRLVQIGQADTMGQASSAMRAADISVSIERRVEVELSAGIPSTIAGVVRSNLRKRVSLELKSTSRVASGELERELTMDPRITYAGVRRAALASGYTGGMQVKPPGKEFDSVGRRALRLAVFAHDEAGGRQRLKELKEAVDHKVFWVVDPVYLARSAKLEFKRDSEFEAGANVVAIAGASIEVSMECSSEVEAVAVGEDRIVVFYQLTPMRIELTPRIVEQGKARNSATGERDGSFFAGALVWKPAPDVSSPPPIAPTSTSGSP
jgi:hypothetical protein